MSEGQAGRRVAAAADGQRPARQIRAVFDAETIVVYQAYGPEIADAALRAGTFVPPFSMTRMTWIKPSFMWMMYRSGWATRPGQERVLAIRMTRSGFESALADAALSHFDPAVYPSREAWECAKNARPVRIQWDPERDSQLRPLPWRSIQIGLAGTAVHAYVSEWITEIGDITDRVRALRSTPGTDGLPDEQNYPLPPAIAQTIGASLDQ